MRQFAAILIMLFIMTGMASCSPYRYEEVIPVVEKMTIERKIGQMMMPAIPGTHIGTPTREIIRQCMPGGIILFGFNLENRAQTIELISSLQDESMARSGIPLFVSIDQEGGRVKRVRDGVTQFPGSLAFGVVNNEDLMYRAARITGLELRQTGVNMNLAPVLDVNNNPMNPVINTRSFGSEPGIVARMGVAYIKGLQAGKCIAVGKHFPGHGDTDRDSHHTLPVIRYDMKRLRNVELVPFKKAIEYGVEGIMTAHIAYPEILDSMKPATISSYFLKELLRDKMKFKGLVLTDDMEMKGIAGVASAGEGAVKAVQAGADIILISSYGKNVTDIYNSLLRAVKDGIISEERIDRSVTRILEQKVRYNIMETNEQVITPAKFLLSEDEKKLLSEAESINNRVSRQAEYFHADDRVPFSRYVIKDNGRNAVIITENKRTASLFKAAFPGITVLPRWDAKKVSGKMIYLVSYSASYRKFKDIITKKNVTIDRVLIIHTGNPFTLAKNVPIPPTLFTFSNTRGSIEAAIHSLGGKYEPRRKINVNLGFKTP
ncbi:MAG: beta-N-acetylhexosaminidase [Spirochaetota bacterium]